MTELLRVIFAFVSAGITWLVIVGLNHYILGYTFPEKWEAFLLYMVLFYPAYHILDHADRKP